MKYVATSMIEQQAPPPAVARKWNGARITGNLLMVFWLLAGIALVWYLFSAWSPSKVDRYGVKYLTGLLTTIQLVVISITMGAILSIPIAFARMSSNKIIGAIAYGYVYLFRGTPLLVQLFLIYFGLGAFLAEYRGIFQEYGLWKYLREAWYYALLAFTLNTAAYQAEILRGAIESVPKGQWEGASALGISKVLAFRKIILPQALIVALRPYGNEIVLMLKGSAIVALVTVLDLMGETRRAFSQTYDFQAYIWAAVFYLIMVESLRNVWSWLEQRLTRHLKR
ncbi:MAG: ABC transporter permease [Pseudomonadota bacterium]